MYTYHAFESSLKRYTFDVIFVPLASKVRPGELILSEIFKTESWIRLIRKSSSMESFNPDYFARYIPHIGENLRP